MVDATHTSFAAHDRSYFSLLKKEIHRRAQEAGILAERLNELDIIVAEMTSNLFKYSRRWRDISGRVLRTAVSPYIELISIDNGPGMVNPGQDDAGWHVDNQYHGSWPGQY